MQLDNHILTLITFLPLIGAGLIFLFANGSNSACVAKKIALGTSVLTFVIAIYILLKFNPEGQGYQFEQQFEWIKNTGIFYHLGIDGISVYFVVLTAFLIPICVLASWKSVTKQVKEYMILFLLLECLVIGVFVSLDFVLFYFFFEASLIPMFIIIGVWGAENRVYAAFKFFLYTLLGSLFLLLAILYLYSQFGTTDIPMLTAKAPELSLKVQKILWLAFLASFAVKVPMWPVHTWLPDAHVQAPTAGSVILAGVLLKLGAYGFLRLSLPMLPDASRHYVDLIYVLSCIAIVYTSLVALMQEDMKKMIAYSSVAHMGYVTAGIFALNEQAVQGAIYQCLSHGIISAALFLCVGVLYDRMHTKKIAAFGGVVQRMPKFALVFLLYTMASVGLPGTSGFVGEFLVMLGVFKDNIIPSLFVTSGVVLGAAYMLWLYKRVMYGEILNDDVNLLADLTPTEKLCLYPLAILAVIYGIYPSLITHDIAPSVQQLLTKFSPAI